jgi:asparagine synthase (glutamine-hydrolysing)
VTRWLAGVFNPRQASDSRRLSGALDPEPAVVLESGPLRVAYTGAVNPGRAPLCLLDGHLDNVADLRAALGCNADAAPEELLAIGWRRWGLDLLSRLRGEFAIVLWDRERHEGVLARDQLGARSLYLHDAFGELCFASEIRQLLALLARRPAPDPVSVAHWITMSNRPGTATLYEGVRRLNPGSALLISDSGAREVAYWEPRYVEPLDEGPDLVQRLRMELDRAVARKMPADGLTGVLMSGGLDSSTVAAVAATQAPGRVLAQAAIFPEHPAVDESQLIEELRAFLSLRGINAEVRSGGLLASALDSISQWQLPLRSWGDFWALPLLRAARRAGVTVTLGGDGGDELFGTRAYLMSDRIRSWHPIQALDLLRELPGAGDHPARRDVVRIYAKTALVGALPYSLHTLALRHLPRGRTPGWLLPATARNMTDHDDEAAWKRLPGPRWWAETAHGLTRGVEETGVFDHQRRRAASAGLQARHALFDLDLVQLCLRLPPRATFDRYRSRPLLRAAMEGLLPDSVRLRPQKALFDSLLIDCLTGADGEIARTLLSDRSAELGAYVDRDAMGKALFGRAAGRSTPSFQWMWQFWRLLTAECWLRSQADSDLATTLMARASPARVEVHEAGVLGAAGEPG